VTPSGQIIQYDRGSGALSNWIVAETAFLPHKLGKAEAVFSLGNGYMGLRSATEEHYAAETRGLFVAGTFDRFPGKKEVTELPNTADVLGIDITLDGELFKLSHGKIIDYQRQLNLKQAELTRQIRWQSAAKSEYLLTFRRFVSLDNLHLIGQKVTITPLTADADISISSGINGRMTNSGTQHFAEGELRLFDGKIMKLQHKTLQSGIDFYHYSRHYFDAAPPTAMIVMDRRRIYQEFHSIHIPVHREWSIEKISGIYTSRDENFTSEEATLKQFIADSGRYEELFRKHTHRWQQKVWAAHPIRIAGNDFDQLAVRFAQYHLTTMTPAHDRRMSIAAKGLSGEGYKGHVFWDTEIFILPYFISNAPDIARRLLEYRYLTLPGAIQKAHDNGYEGAMFPWESAWMEDGEVTPVYGGADVVTGKYTKIWSGMIEQHITADIAYAFWLYHRFTGDDDFMNRYGYEVLFLTAIFWASRLEWNESRSRYEINDVIGPDEYKEHANNNAYTNYMAHWNLAQAVHAYHELKNNNPHVFNRLNHKWKLDNQLKNWQTKADRLYLPQPDAQNIIPQDDQYLNKKIIDLTPYKAMDRVGTLFDHYNINQVSHMQVTKQADIITLLYLLGDQFSTDVKQANWNYYEPKTLHDSSLSRSIHAILANDLGYADVAYQMFAKASRIDLGENMDSSNMGIHAASIAGIWLDVVNGFGGVRLLDRKLHVRPHLPKQWKALSFPIIWRGSRLWIELSQETRKVTNQSDRPISVVLDDREKVVAPHSFVLF
jgi:hypothetical glycosyl hydrolase